MKKHYKEPDGTYTSEGLQSPDAVEITLEEIETEREAMKTPDELKEEARVVAKSDRDTALMSMVHTLSDGSVVQVRPIDLPNFEISIALGVDEEWVLADNSVRLLTVAEMTECKNSGIVQGKAIWDTYKTALKAL